VRDLAARPRAGPPRCASARSPIIIAERTRTDKRAGYGLTGQT